MENFDEFAADPTSPGMIILLSLMGLLWLVVAKAAWADLRDWWRRRKGF